MTLESNHYEGKMEMSKKLVTCLVVGASVLLIGNNLSAVMAEDGIPEGFYRETVKGQTITYTNDQTKCLNCKKVPSNVAQQLKGCINPVLCWMK